jgi:hypothetical protein
VMSWTAIEEIPVPIIENTRRRFSVRISIRRVKVNGFG